MRTRRSQNGTLSIGMLSVLTGIEIHTLRYWESEFPDYLCPLRTPGGQRRYDPYTVERVNEIQRLLKTERYTVAGARQYLAAQYTVLEKAA
jgi:DNA-binding transcriptional MerR regulator